jgi:hypothetical protein
VAVPERLEFDVTLLPSSAVRSLLALDIFAVDQ